MEEYKVMDKPHRSNYIGGTQRIYRFPNGYGASVVNGKILHSFPFYLELAVIKFDGKTNDEFELRYDTGITGDVMIIEDDAELMAVLNKIRRLK